MTARACGGGCGVGYHLVGSAADTRCGRVATVSAPPVGRPPVVLTDRLGGAYTVDPSVMSDDLRWVLLNGRCGDVALAVSRATGWPVALHLVQQYDDDNEPTEEALSHVLVVRPDNTLLDADGVWTDEEYEDDALSEEARLEVVNAAGAEVAVRAHDGFATVDPDALAPFVPLMLALR